ncbi:hypothetical protein GYMLUDRAFT_836362 [Collybiopsis luxurians FD-317 M1]|uniref:Uncharacterized protein n=1 Tax=Collybiopsis luxurians FD-317 M1 TaxID=944289 RepID=A0A0D0BLA1_9AGAR|nr:hypothetical protein GYMLUDRAFT_836362 [Collybiopsis luxurians FD-317 M1]
MYHSQVQHLETCFWRAYAVVLLHVLFLPEPFNQSIFFYALQSFLCVVIPFTHPFYPLTCLIQWSCPDSQSHHI